MKVELSTENPYLEICFRPTVATISEARRFVAALYQPLLDDPDAVSRVAIATHELLENALKYSLDGRTVIRVELSRATRPLRLSVETRNRISEERKAGLEEVFEEMRHATSAADHYQKAMQRARTRRYGSGLGLARIWEESEMILSRSYVEDEVRVVAVAMLNDNRAVVSYPPYTSVSEVSP